MSWNVPRTWSPAETETAAIFNLALRDNLNVLKTCQTNAGVPKLAYKTWYYGGASTVNLNANAAGAGLTELTSFTTTLPANFFTTYGEVLCFMGTWSIAANANTKAISVGLGGASSSVYSRPMNVANGILLQITYMSPRLFTGGSSPQLAVWGRFYSDGNAATPVAPAPVLSGTSFTMSAAFTAPLTFAIYASSTTAADMVLTEATLFSGLSAVAGGNP